MENSIVSQSLDSAIEQALIAGDLSKLTPAQRVSYYHAVCNSLDLNPLTRPFDYITLNGKLVLYAKKEATDQLRDKRGVSIEKLEKEVINGIYTVTAYVRSSDGRTDASTGAVYIEQLKGDALANALMKTETKAKRRATLSICGLGMLDETELETIPSARIVTINDNITEKKPVEEILDELGYDANPEVETIPFEPKMDIETAKLITNSKNVKYGDLDRDAWVAMDRNIAIKIRSGDLTPEQRDEYQYKLDALAVLINS